MGEASRIFLSQKVLRAHRKSVLQLVLLESERQLPTAPTCPHSGIDPKKYMEVLRMGLFSCSKGIFIVGLIIVTP